jgi:CBS domain-containing protein
MGLLAEKGVNQVPVVHDGRLLGLVTRDDILKWMVLGPQRRPAGGPDAE